MIRDHRPAPGPDYWSWRCLTCGYAVADHVGWLGRLLWRIKRWSW